MDGGGKNRWRPDTQGNAYAAFQEGGRRLEAEAKEAMRAAGNDEDALKVAGALFVMPGTAAESNGVGR